MAAAGSAATAWCQAPVGSNCWGLQSRGSMASCPCKVLQRSALCRSASNSCGAHSARSQQVPRCQPPSGDSYAARTDAQASSGSCCSQPAADCLAAYHSQSGLHPSLQRRQFLAGAACLALWPAVAPANAAEAPGGAGGGAGLLSRYIKKKKLDPLVTYLPPLLAARGQLLAAGDLVGSDAAAARQLLRSGAFYGVRDNVRAVGEYAEAAGVAGAANLVSGFFAALEAFDFTLLQARREGKPPPADTAQQQVQAAIAALDRLLATVPEAELGQARAIIDRLERGAGGAEDAAAAPAAEGGDLEKLVP